MAKKNEFIEFLLESLHDFEGVKARAMFGGFGIYKNGIMFALVADNMLYMKVDEQSKPEFESQGLGPFVYHGHKSHKKPTAMSYHEIPAEALDNPKELCEWAQKGYSAAMRAKKSKKK